ncbi:hypothetical protein QYM36_019823 [Artemia franciscana]|uniref:Uncharacterized protein n=1 Tax=Artemia franciscana TaxID=6661 RepID=A0AA88H0R4_ARTSF|nr:hypothetical protein QYM36_019823 [Artemia franciscana]
MSLVTRLNLIFDNLGLNEAEIDTLMILFLIVGNIGKIAAGILTDKKKNLEILIVVKLHISSIALAVPSFLGALQFSSFVQFCDPCLLCENSTNVTADVHNHLSAESTKFWRISLISGIIGCAFSSLQVLSDCWALKTLREETPQGRDSLIWKKFGYMKAIAAIGGFLAMLVKQADSSYSNRIPLADGLQEDREQTDSINQGVNRYSYGVFRNIKDIWVGSANTCLLLVPKMLAGFSRGLASRQFPRILEEMLIVRCEFPGSFKTTRYVRLVFQYMLGEGLEQVKVKASAWVSVLIGALSTSQEKLKQLEGDIMRLLRDLKEEEQINFYLKLYQEVLSDCWALKTLREETPQGRDSLTWKKFGYMKAIAAIGDFLAMLVKQADSSYSSHAFTKLLPYMIVSVFVMVDLFVLWCSFQERIPLADGIQKDREQTDSINQGVNSYSCGVFRNIKDIWVGSANICLFLLEQAKVKASARVSVLIGAWSTSQEKVKQLENDIMRLLRDLKEEEQINFLFKLYQEVKKKFKN